MNLGVLHHTTSLGHLSYQGSPSLSRKLIFIWPSIDLIIQPFYCWALVLLKFSKLEVGDLMMMLFLIRSCFTEPRVELHLVIHFSSVAQFVSDFLQPHGLQHTGFPVHHQLPELTQTHVHWVGDATQPSHPLSSPSPPALNFFPSIRVFSNESILHIRWPTYWSFSFSISPSNEYSGLISFRMDWLDLLAVQGTLKSLLQHHSSRASILWCSTDGVQPQQDPVEPSGWTASVNERETVRQSLGAKSEVYFCMARLYP